MRIIAGEARSRRLVYPRGAGVRPTTDAMRESLFSSLAERVAGARFADLYAGGGSVGLEALSRGAQSCVFLEKDRRCLQALATNLANTGLADRATVLPGPAEKTWSRATERGPYEIIFADPPYGLEGFAELAERILAGGEGVAQGGLVVVQCRAELALPGLPPPDRVRRFGESELRFYERP